VVVGGSMAGLLAARVLADHFEHVVIVERDLLPESAEDRKGVPQGRMLHVLLPRGLGIIGRLFPGYREDLETAGAVSIRVPGDVLLLGPAGWLDRRAEGWAGVSATRPLFEATVRRRLRALSGIAVLDGHEVVAPLASRDGSRVQGVRVRPVGADGNAFDLDADLVVDASGRGSRAPHWLVELGYPEPARTSVDPDVAYASRVFRIPDGFAADWKLLMVTSSPPTMPRTGYLFPIEGGRWMVALMGAGGQHPPTDEEGYTAFVRSLRHPVIADAIRDAEPLTPVRGHRGTANRRWHFERMRRWPERFVVLGDAVCAFNPIYGQGISCAAVAAATLGDCLWEQRRRHRSGDLDGLAAGFQRKLARATADAWMLSTGEDLRFPTTTGMQAGARLRAQHRYLDRVVAASTADPEVADVYVRILGMVERPSALFSPHIAAAAARARFQGPDTAPPPRPRDPAGTLVGAGV
jgi:2-polyprenyl-6-methoxyphenol hydroxylase-like FAD-dependent oxidoreductase